VTGERIDGWRTDVVVIALLATTTYLLLGQDVFFKADGHHLVQRLIDGNAHSPHHKLYMPLLIGFAKLTASLGLSAYRTAVVFSGLLSAAGVTAAYVGYRLFGLGRSNALWTTALVGTCPAIVFFATVVEFHGPFFGFAGLAFLTVGLLFRFRRHRAAFPLCVVVGIATALAAGVHASGLILPALFLPWFLARYEPEQRWRRGLALALVAGVVHTAAIFVLANPLDSEGFVDRGFGHPQGIAYIPGVAWQEWISVFLPISVTCLFAIRGKHRLELAAFGIALVPYLYGAMRLLVGEPEFGAYLLPLALLAAWLTVAALPRPLPAILVVVSVVLAVARVVNHEGRWRKEYETYARGAEAAIGDDPAWLLIGDAAEMGPILVFRPRMRLVLLNQLAAVPPEKFDPAVFDAFVAGQAAAGKKTHLTKGGRAFLAQKLEPFPSGPILLAYIESHYELVPHRSGSFEAFELVKR